MSSIITFRRMSDEEDAAATVRIKRQMRNEFRRKEGLPRAKEFTFWYTREQALRRSGQYMPPPKRGFY